jgi:hypothetical protein
MESGPLVRPPGGVVDVRHPGQGKELTPRGLIGAQGAKDPFDVQDGREDPAILNLRYLRLAHSRPASQPVAREPDGSAQLAERVRQVGTLLAQPFGIEHQSGCSTR